MFEICPETDSDTPEVEALYDLCFAPGRSALSSYRLREGVPMVADLCRVLRDGGGILLAAIRFWPVRVDTLPVLLLGPIAVHPTAQGEGFGAILMRDSLARARDLGWARVMLVGDAPYYGRFGFVRLDHVEMPPPTNPDRVLGLELRAGAWAGVRGRVERASDGVIRAGLAEMAATPHIGSACDQIDHPREAEDDRTRADGAPADH